MSRIDILNDDGRGSRSWWSTNRKQSSANDSLPTPWDRTADHPGADGRRRRGPKLAAAVSNAGGLGMLVPWRANIATVRQQIQDTRALTSKPFGVNLNLEFPQEERLEASLDEGVRIISFFWRDPAALMPRAKEPASPFSIRSDRARPPSEPSIAASTSSSPKAGRQAATSAAPWRPCRSLPPWSTLCHLFRLLPLEELRTDAGLAAVLGARRSRRLDRHPFSRQPGGNHPSALSRARVEGQRDRYGFCRRSVRHRLAESTASRFAQQDRGSLGGRRMPAVGQAPGEGEVIATSGRADLSFVIGPTRPASIPKATLMPCRCGRDRASASFRNCSRPGTSCARLPTKQT